MSIEELRYKVNLAHEDVTLFYTQKAETLPSCIDTNISSRRHKRRRYVLCYTDGSTKYGESPWISAAGYGVFFCKKHRANVQAKLEGGKQTTPRAEARAVLEAIKRAATSIISIDSIIYLTHHHLKIRLKN